MSIRMLTVALLLISLVAVTASVALAMELKTALQETNAAGAPKK